MSYEPQNLQELAHSFADERAERPDAFANLSFSDFEEKVLELLRKARTLTPDPAND